MTCKLSSPCLTFASTTGRTPVWDSRPGIFPPVSPSTLGALSESCEVPYSAQSWKISPRVPDIKSREQRDSWLGRQQ